MVPETRYARSGDVNIAYQLTGDGPMDLVYVMGWVSNLEAFWQEPSVARFFYRLASFSRLILFDNGVPACPTASQSIAYRPLSSEWTMFVR